MDLSIIIVNYKTPVLVIDCINSIYKQTNRYSFEIIVVDNHSQDDSKEQILKSFPQVLWIDMGYNSGFARGNNAGIKIAKGDFILLLNGDTLIQEHALDTTIDLLRQHTEVVACGVQLLNEDGTTQISGAHIIKGGLNTLLPIPYLGRLVRYLGYRFNSTVPSVQTIQNYIEVDWIVGAFIMVKKEVLKKSGLLDEDFFMYAEEIEWCHRLKKQGKLCLFGGPAVTHIGGGSSSEAYNTSSWDNSKNLWSRKAKQIMVSTLVRIRKQFGIFWSFVILGFYILGVPVFIIGLLFEKIVKAGNTKYTWANVSGYMFNVGAMIKYFGRILINKPFFYKVN